MRSMVVRPKPTHVYPLLLVLFLALTGGTIAYQAPVRGSIAVGWLGDQLFLDSSMGLGEESTRRGDWYADDLTPDSPTGRSRWMRQHGVITLPNIGAGTVLSLTLVVQGWPRDVLRAPPESTTVSRWPLMTADSPQPTVTVRVNGHVLEIFTPTSTWQPYNISIPASERTSDDLRLDIRSSAVFTDTLRGPDPRPKGIRVAAIHLAEEEPLPTPEHTQNGFSETAPDIVPDILSGIISGIVPPAWRAILLLIIDSMLLSLLLTRVFGSPSSSFLATSLLTGSASIGIALARLWMGAILIVVLWVLVIALLIAYYRPLLRLLRSLLWRYGQGRALNYGLITASLAWIGYTVGKFIAEGRSLVAGEELVKGMFPDSLLIVLLSASLLALIFVLGRDGLPSLANRLSTVLEGQRGALALLLLCGMIWFGYETVVVSRLPYVGHADYADNAVVARNLVEGRGWVVDYVTQFYRSYADTTRPQETWPLLQPVWMAPFIALFGAEAWAAKIPNLLFNAVLLWLIYTIGSYLWDRRIGVTAAVLTLTNHLFFKLTIYTTSDLAFVVFTTAALALLYRALDTSDAPPNASTITTISPWQLGGAGVLTGLMMLQKPSGAVIAVGMGVWLLLTLSTEWHIANEQGRRRVSPLAIVQAACIWAVPAVVILSPYLARNMMLFGKPVFSTESYDAWILGYRGESAEAWNDIYRVYAPAFGGSGPPDRSWILRWGFDLTLEKMRTQVAAVRDYLLPMWRGVTHSDIPLIGPPSALSTPPVSSTSYLAFLSHDSAKNLLAPLGAWLSFLGAIAAVRYRRRLIGLLFLSFAPYTVFLITYWHANEERYFLMTIPWLALLAAWVLWRIFDRLAAIGDGRWSPLGIVIVLLAVVAIIRPSWSIIAHKIHEEPDRWQPDVIAYEWLKEHTPEDAVMMTRNPWQLNWHADRPAVMIPNTADEETFAAIARHYEVDYLVFETLQRVKGDAARLLDPLVGARDAEVGQTIRGYELVYASPTPDNRVLIYRVPRIPHVLHNPPENP